MNQACGLIGAPGPPQGGGEGSAQGLCFQESRENLRPLRGPAALFPHTGQSQCGTRPPGTVLQQRRTGVSHEAAGLRGTNAQAATVPVSTQLGPRQEGAIRMTNVFSTEKPPSPEAGQSYRCTEMELQARPTVRDPHKRCKDGTLAFLRGKAIGIGQLSLSNSEFKS